MAVFEIISGDILSDDDDWLCNIPSCVVVADVRKPMCRNHRISVTKYHRRQRGIDVNRDMDSPYKKELDRLEKTNYNYSLHIKKLSEYMGGNWRIATEGDIASFLMDYFEEGVNDKTVMKASSAINTVFYEYNRTTPSHTKVVLETQDLIRDIAKTYWGYSSAVNYINRPDGPVSKANRGRYVSQERQDRYI